MAKYLVETYYSCSFKVSHYLDDITSNNLQNLEKREDGKYEILDVKLDNRKTKNLDDVQNKKIEIFEKEPKKELGENSQKKFIKITENMAKNISDGVG